MLSFLKMDKKGVQNVTQEMYQIKLEAQVSLYRSPDIIKSS